MEGLFLAHHSLTQRLKLHIEMKRSSLVHTYFFSGNIFPWLTIPRGTFFNFIFTCITFFIVVNTNAQQTEDQRLADYKKTITERSAKIVKSLELKDSAKYERVVTEVANQYFSLNRIHEQFKTAIASVKSQQLEKTAEDEAVKRQEEKKSSQLLQQHTVFIALLKKELSDEQSEKIKNGMTYNVLNVTYTAYLDMLLNLTAEQKQKIYNWLVEARELAMDEGSSDDKHKVFGKYKGKINNYLSVAGYDMKKEEKEWQSRIKEKQNSTKQSS
jgi:hypothetical protein